MNNKINKVVEFYTESKQESTKADFHNWLVDDEFKIEKEDALYDLWSKTDYECDQSILHSLNKFKRGLQDQSMFKRKNVVVWRYAAVITFLLCSTFLVYIFFRGSTVDNFVEYYSPTGQTKIFELPDGSQVCMNAGSLVLYSEDFGTTNRTLHLIGEADFKVTKNKKLPFVVKTSRFMVTALGTEFIVSSYPEDKYFRTTLISGSIEVNDKNNSESFILTKNEQFTYSNLSQEYSVNPIDINEVTAWQRDEIIFRGATIHEIVSVMERKFSVVFVYKASDFDGDKYNFHFRKGAGLSEMMSVIKEVADLDYKVINDKHYIEINKR